MSSVNRYSSTALRFALVLAAAAAFSIPAMGQEWARNDGSIPLAHDWSSRYVVYTSGYSQEQFEKMMKDPRAYATMLAHGIHGISQTASPVHTMADASQLTRPDLYASWLEHENFKIPRFREHQPVSSAQTLKRDWAVSLGAGGVAEGMYPAKYTFDVNATPSCANDFAVFPVNVTTGNARTKIVGTFSTSGSKRRQL